MKKTSLFLLSYLTCVTAFAQIKLPAYPDSAFSTYYNQRATHFKTLPVTQDDIVFLGNSITDGAEWAELFDNPHVKNRGISGDITTGVMHRLNEVTTRKPSKLFLLIGINDLAAGLSPDSVAKNILRISQYIRQQTPTTALFIQSILPVNNRFSTFKNHTAKGAQILSVNSILQKNAGKNSYTFLDIHRAFCDPAGRLNDLYTNDGLHLNGNGYALWKHLVFASVNGLQENASLIPLPQKLIYNSEKFPLYLCKTIWLKDRLLQTEAVLLQKMMAEKGLLATITEKQPQKGPYIAIGKSPVKNAPNSREAYELRVSKNEVSITGETNTGVFYALKTLKQLMRDGMLVNGCSVTDWPEFTWRGYMVDVGRNFQSVPRLKEQIDVMANYKLNIFHFHFTEDIAWRLAIREYPQLTAPENMLRNKGMFYTEAEFADLVSYARSRHITLVPEIDMPGHSGAFKRAMKTDMQSDTGIHILKNILKSFFSTYNLPYFHIGADEVKIHNTRFIPEMTAYVESFGKKTIGWEPGGNFGAHTIRQLWMDDAAKRATGKNLRFIDSRHLYINHMDPLESVVTIFNRKIGNVEKGDSSVLGGTLCLWPDRAVAKEDDIFKQNAVYPAMLTFAERSWRGGGRPGWTAIIGTPGSDSLKVFEEYESRLLDQKITAFNKVCFPYVKQTNLVWKLYGPFKNNGDPSKKFLPETSPSDIGKKKAAKEVVGGTIVMRHWWAPLISGAIDSPSENTTWYATTNIWSEEDTVKEFWIGMNDLSRSPATDSPKPGTWNNYGGKIWLNGAQVQAPEWLHASYKGNPEIPLTDESYTYRMPTKLKLKKGWNTVIIKSPIQSFKANDWQNPVKLMFTFVPL